MLTGLPPLTADAHEFKSTAEPFLSGSGWALIAITGSTPSPAQWQTGWHAVYHWARRKDGLPLVKPDTWHTDMLALEGQLRAARETIAKLEGLLMANGIEEGP